MNFEKLCVSLVAMWFLGCGGGGGGGTSSTTSTSSGTPSGACGNNVYSCTYLYKDSDGKVVQHTCAELDSTSDANGSAFLTGAMMDCKNAMMSADANHIVTEGHGCDRSKVKFGCQNAAAAPKCLVSIVYEDDPTTDMGQAATCTQGGGTAF